MFRSVVRFDTSITAAAPRLEAETRVPASTSVPYELERFVCGVLADIDDAESVIPMELRRHWNGLDELEQLRALRDVIHRVVYSRAAEKISVVLRDDWKAAIASIGP